LEKDFTEEFGCWTKVSENSEKVIAKVKNILKNKRIATSRIYTYLNLLSDVNKQKCQRI